MMMREKEIKILLSYHRHDIEWRDLFDNGLKSFQEPGQLSIIYYDEVAEASQSFEDNQKDLRSFDVIILCISKKYLFLKNYIEKEIPEKILPLQEHGSRVIPVYLQDCPWQSISWLHEIRLWPSPDLPFSNMSESEREKYISRFIEDELKLTGAEETKSTFGKGKHGEGPYSGEDRQGGKFKDVDQLSEAFKKFLVEKKDYDKSFMLQHERDGGFDDRGIDKGKRQYMAIFDHETQKQLAIVEFGLKENESTILAAWQYHMYVKRNAESADIEGYCVFPVAAGLGEKFSIVKFDKDGKGYESLLCEDFPTYEDLRRKREKETEASVGKGGDNSRNDDWRKDFTRFLTEEKKWLEIDFANEKYKTMAIDLSIRHPESKKLIAVIDFKESIDRNIESKAKASFAQFAELELGKYLVTPSSEKSNYSFTIYKYSDRGLVRMQPSDFPAYEESEPETPDEKLTLSNFESKLDVDGIKIFNEVIGSAESSSIGLDIQITDESYINLRSTWPERKTDNVVMQIHRYGEPDTRIALAVAGIKTGATMSTKPKLNDHITKGVMSLLSGYEKGIAGEIAWLNGNLPVKGTREKASVYVIEREIVNNPEALNGVEELLEWAVENFDKLPSEKPDKDKIIGNVPTIQIEGIGEKDRLGREKLVKTLAGMFAQTECDNGFTMALLGDWGQGKSTVMGLLEKELNRKHEGKFEFATYNAWEYEKTENVSAGIAQEVVKGLTVKIGKWERFVLRFKFAWKEHNEKLRWFLTKVIIILALLVVSLGVKLWLKNEPSWSAIIPLALGGGAISLPLLSYKDLKRMFEHPLSTQLETYLKLPDYGEHLGLVPVLKRHIKTLWGFQFDEQKKLIVFVDDLDRCNVDHIANVLDSIRLVMTIPNVIVMIGIDHRIAFKAIRKHYKELADGDDTRGSADIARDYLGKIIQLPLRLRAASHGELKDYVFEKLFDKKNIVDDTKSEEPPKTDVPKEPGAQTTKGGRPTGGGEENTESETTGSEKDIAEAIKDKASERRLFYELVGKFGFSNPRQLLRLHNSFRFLKGYGRGKGEGYDTLDMLRMLFWQEFLLNWPVNIRGRCMAALIDEAHGEGVKTIVKRVLDKVRNDIAQLFNGENYAELAEFVRIVVLPHNEEGIFDTKEDINEWLKKEKEAEEKEASKKTIAGE